MLAALAACLGCSDSGFDKTPRILFENLSGVYGADVQQQGLGRLVMTLENVEDTRTVYTAEMTNLVDGAETMLEGIGTVADDHLILNFDRGKDSDFYFESSVLEDGNGFIELDGQFVFPDSAQAVSAKFTQPLSAS